MFDIGKVNFKTAQSNIEINSLMGSESQRYAQSRQAKENVEIFSNMVRGKDISKYDGARVDAIFGYMTNLAKKANSGNTKAMAELNAIRTMMIEAPLQKRLQLMDMMGETMRVGKNEEIRFKVYELQGEKSREQANNSTFPFVTSKYRTETMTNYKTITGGALINNRELETGNLDVEAVMVEQVQTDMMNQMFYYIYNELYTGIKNATSLKNFAEATGVAKSTLDGVLKKARRFSQGSRPVITGDYSVVSQLNAFSGFATNATTGALTDVRYSEAVMEEIRATGVLETYNGSPVIEIPNEYDLTKINTTGDFFETYLPEGLLFVMPNGTMSPLKIGLRGGIESMSATDINTRSEVMRFDLQFGTHLVKEHVPAMGLISDDTYAVDKR